MYPNSASIVLGYDYANRLTNMVDRAGTTKFSWTAAGQLAGEDGLWDNDAVSYGYTHRLRTSLGLAQPNASAWSQGYTYDDYWRLGTLTSPAGTFTTAYKSVYASGTGYTASDLVQQLTQPSGAYIRDQRDRRSGIQLSCELALSEPDCLYKQWNAAHGHNQAV